ncbi:lysophospholipase [Leuconostoc carnosum]|uniref:GDSL-type esterase/lipase family protein n=1 Tax=Leuconostoc carnosum TaxID=1252 RepID=UPI00123B6753|nr:GDSL-type esterase/lipase family protein [Leuconostoc carnosum]KAA8359647.1 lysophospholipase [Leuconostoc carnosum]KAA8365221.1 lysophospholipase [Leuconostoc carnosum]
MKEIELTALLSPEWGIVENHFITTQFGASVICHTVDVSKIQLVFDAEYDGLTFEVQINHSVWTEYVVIDKKLTIDIREHEADICIILRTWLTDSLNFWQHPVTLTTLLVDQGIVTPVNSNPPYITFVGDSITAGESMDVNGHHPELSYPFLVAEALKKPLNRIAYGGTGLTASAPFQQPTAVEALWHVADNVIRPRVVTDLVIINYGTNDFNYGATQEAFAFGLRIYLLELIKRFHSAKMVLLIPFSGAFETIYQREIKRFDNFVILDTSHWQIDNERVHPLMADHQRIAELILKGL